MRKLFRYPTDSKALQHSEPLARAAMSSVSVGSSVYSLLFISANQQACWIKEAEGPFGFSKSRSRLFPSFVKIKMFLGIMVTGNSASKGCLYSPSVFRRDSVSAAWCFILAWWAMWTCNCNSLGLHHTSMPVALAMVRLYRRSSWSIRIVVRAPSGQGCRSVRVRWAVRPFLCVSGTSYLSSFQVLD